MTPELVGCSVNAVISGTCFFNCSHESGDLCGFFSCFTVKEDNAKNRISFWSCFAVAVDSRFVSKGISTT